MIPVRSLAAIVATAGLLTWMPPAGADTGFSISISGGNRYSHGRFHGGYRDRFHGYSHGYPRAYRPFHYGYPRYYGYRPYYGPYWRPGYAYRGFWYPRPVEPRCIYRYGYLYCR